MSKVTEVGVNVTDAQLRDLAARFVKYTRLTESGCLEWMGERTHGYGRVRFARRKYLAHRAAYYLRHGVWPTEPHARHQCRNPPCVNIAHILWGTAKENADDKQRDGTTARGPAHSATMRRAHILHPERRPRGDAHGSRLHPESRARGDRNGSRLHPERCPRGEAHGCAKLTTAQVADIRAKHVAGASGRGLAREFGVSETTVRDILLGRTWQRWPVADHRRGRAN